MAISYGSIHIDYIKGDSIIFKNIEKVMGLQQPAGRDYVLSIELSWKLLNQVSKVREILTRRNSTKNLRFWNRSSFAVWEFP